MSSVDSTMVGYHRAQHDAETGSHQLKLSIEAMFDNFAAKHRISYKDASELILNYGLRRG